MQARKEGECSDEQISANIAKLIDEGKAREVAIAIAFEGCPQQRTEYKHALRRVTIVDDVKGIIRGYAFIWGSPEHRDSYQTYFDKEAPPEAGLDFLPKMLMYEHGFDGGIKKDIIGRVTRIWFDEIGAPFEAALDKTHAAFTRFISEIRSGKLSTSSATAEHLAEFDSDGRFVNWPILEITLTAKPSEELMPDVQLMRSQLSHGATAKSQGEMTANERKQGNTREGHNIMNPQEIIAALVALGEGATIEQIIDVLISGGLTKEDFDAVISQVEMPDKGRQDENGETVPAAEGEGDTPATAEVVSLVDQLVPALTVVLEEKQAVEAVAQLEEVRSKHSKLVKDSAKMALQIAAHRSQQGREQAMPNLPNQPRHSGGGDNRITVGNDMKYAGLNSRQMGYGYQLLKASGQPISDDYLRNMAGKTIDLVAKGESAFRNDKSYYAVRSAIRGATRADELVYTTNTGFGAEWIPDMWETQAWDVARQELVFDTMTRDMMVLQVDGRPGSTATVPLVDSDPTFFKANENKSVGADLEAKPLVDPSHLGTAKVEITPVKGMARVIVTEEMIEDSIIPVLSQLDQQFTAAFAEQMESLLINGDTDTTASTNINLIDGTPAGGTSAPAYLITDGILKYALVTGGAAGLTTKVAGGVLTTKDFIKGRSLLARNLISDPSKLVFFSDNDVFLKMLDVTDVKDLSVFRNPTIESGVLFNLWGSPYLQSGQMALANSAGKISATAGNNTLGRIGCFYPRYWAMVWKRQIKFATMPDIRSDTTEVVASFRVAFKNRSASAASVIYNLTVAL